MTNLQQNIEQEVGAFVRSVSELVRRAAIEALERAIVLPTPVVVEPARQPRRPSKKSRGSSRPRVKRKPAPARDPRDPAELAALTERLYGAIAAQPGETMEVLAPAVGCRGTDLRVSIGHLLERGRVKKAGDRRSTRYFPMDTDER